MAGKKSVENQQGQEPDATSKKRSVFPRYSVTRAAKLARNIVSENTHLKKERICLNLSLSTSSSRTDSLFGAARRYGLIKDERNGFISATELARRVLSDNDSVRMAAVAEANGRFEPYSRFLQQFAEKTVPSAGAAEDVITAEFNVPRAEAQSFYRVIMANAEDSGLIEELPGGRLIRTTPLMPPSTTDGGDEIAAAIDEEPKLQQPPDPPEPGVPPPGKAVEMHFNIQIHLPETTDPAVYNAIFASIKEHLLGS